MSQLPIEVYTSDKELQESLDYWKKKLFLEDWIIKARVCHKTDFDDQNSMGENIFCQVNKCSYIKILDPDDYNTEYIMKYCAEKILVHELLHCRYNWISTPDSVEGIFWHTYEHAFLEQMAKSLIMVKYGVSLDYFK